MTLRVKLEIVPFGNESKIREIGRLDIFNMGRVEFGHCEYGTIDLSPEQIGLHTRTVLHRRDNGAWHLVKKVLDVLEITGP